MSKASQITIIFVFLGIIITILLESILYAIINLLTLNKRIDIILYNSFKYTLSNLLTTNQPLNIFSRIIPFSVILGVILYQVPKSVKEKIRYLNVNYLSPLLELCYSVEPEYYIGIEDMRVKYTHIIKYGKYHMIPCYPWGLMKEFNLFLKNGDEHNKLIRELEDISNKMIGRDILNILNSLLGLISNDLTRYDEDDVNQHKQVADYIQNNKPDFLDKLKQNYEEMRKIKLIIKKLQNFLIENSLGFPRDNKLRYNRVIV